MNNNNRELFMFGSKKREKLYTYKVNNYLITTNAELTNFGTAVIITKKNKKNVDFLIEILKESGSKIISVDEIEVEAEFVL